ncbi:MAG TPA: HEAT repeat domain-containing protein [Terriglobales bacterium]|nr:HEAT repeat domain-containing protein [Terriglobales bacterium]
MLLEDIAALVLWLTVAVAAINLVFLGSVVYRRLARGRYFRRKDEARRRWRTVVDQFLRWGLSQGQAVAVLAEAKSEAAQDAVREMLLARMASDTCDRITALLFGLGAVDGWARAAFGKRAGGVMISALAVGRIPFPERPRNRLRDWLERTRLLAVPRTLAVDALGRLAPDFAEVFALAALEDPAGEVRRVALSSLGRNRRVAGIAPLFSSLLEALAPGPAEEHATSARTAKAALVCYGLEHLRRFVPYLRDPDPQVRFYVVDIVREICARQARLRRLGRSDLPGKLYQEFLDSLVGDESADVRARSAPVVAHFHDLRASIALLHLLRDENEFVRLHAVRAAADPAYPELLPVLVKRMTDRRWRVREAAARALARLGDRAQQMLFREFAGSVDRYESEQITEELQRCGLVHRVLEDLGAGGARGELALAVCRRMVAVGKTALLKDRLAPGREATGAGLLLLEAFATRPGEETARMFEQIALSGRHPLAARAAELLGEMRGRPLAAGVA